MAHSVFAGRLSPGGLLPEWAVELGRACGRYVFTAQPVHGGRSVLARKTGDGTGPMVVITGSEEEMRAALGLKPRTPPP